LQAYQQSIFQKKRLQGVDQNFEIQGNSAEHKEAASGPAAKLGSLQQNNQLRQYGQSIMNQQET